MQKEMPIINVTSRCNQRCVFCSRTGAEFGYPPGRIKAVINEFRDAVCFEGGEPTLSPDILKWIRYARGRKVREILLVTNGFGLEKPGAAEKFLEAGVTLFNVNLPAHDARTFDMLTQTSANFEKRVAAVRNLIRVAGGKKVRITLVVNSIILAKMPDYARFIMREFPELFYLEINFPKALGSCARRPWLVPALTRAEPFIMETFRVLGAGGMNFITDGFPLCFMKGFEHRSIDAHCLVLGKDRFFLAEKEHCPPCVECSFSAVCRGPRKDYAARYGWKELRRQKKSPGFITRKFRRGPGRAPSGAI